jgi:hypothetical protein
VSAVNLGEHGPVKIITRSDLKASMQSYENVSLLFIFLPLLPPTLFAVRKQIKVKGKAHISSLFLFSIVT